MEEDLWWKKTFDRRQPLIEEDFDGRRFWWKTPFDGRRCFMEDNLWWKTIFDERQTLRLNEVWHRVLFLLISRLNLTLNTIHYNSAMPRMCWVWQNCKLFYLARVISLSHVKIMWKFVWNYDKEENLTPQTLHAIKHTKLQLRLTLIKF